MVNTVSLGTLPDNRAVHIYTLTNDEGWTVTLTDFGASIRDIIVPDRSGNPTNITLCPSSFASTIANKASFGATCGRVANRIRGARFVLNGREYQLEANDPRYILHGGTPGFSHTLWRTEAVTDDAVTFALNSPAGDKGFPGALNVIATYTWDDACKLGIDYKAVTDADTIVNLTNHVYFNLNGPTGDNIADQILQLDCDFFLPVDKDVCVTGEVRKVAGTAMDFSEPRVIGSRLYEDDEQLKNGLGYDFSYVLRQGNGLRRCAAAQSAQTGIMLETFTDYPAVHFYTGNGLQDIKDEHGASYRQYGAFCLETQLFPDFMNCPAFEKHILYPGDLYHHHTDYIFSVVS